MTKTKLTLLKCLESECRHCQERRPRGHEITQNGWVESVGRAHCHFGIASYADHQPKIVRKGEYCVYKQYKKE